MVVSLSGDRRTLIESISKENGVPDRTQTCDLSLRRAAFYSTELLGHGVE